MFIQRGTISTRIETGTLSNRQCFFVLVPDIFHVNVIIIFRNDNDQIPYRNEFNDQLVVEKRLCLTR